MIDPWSSIVSWVGAICVCVVIVAVTVATVVRLFSKSRQAKTTKIQ